MHVTAPSYLGFMLFESSIHCQRKMLIAHVSCCLLCACSMSRTWITSSHCLSFQIQKYLACIPMPILPKTSKKPISSLTASSSLRYAFSGFLCSSPILFEATLDHFLKRISAKNYHTIFFESSVLARSLCKVWCAGWPHRSRVQRLFLHDVIIRRTMCRSLVFIWHELP